MFDRPSGDGPAMLRAATASSASSTTFSESLAQHMLNTTADDC